VTDEAQANWQYCEDFISEDDVLLAARETAAELGCVPVLPGTGALLRVLARTLDARAVAEIGTGVGVSSVYLLGGMHPEGVITSIDIEPEHHVAARVTLAAAGITSERFRLITGPALTVLPRLTDAAYDLVLVDAVKSEYAAYVEHAVRLLRPGGVLAIDNALWHSRVPDPAQRDHNTTAIRETLREVRANANLLTVLVPSGDGLLVAVKR
jgi:predicted O-methyltransferase YrrM